MKIRRLSLVLLIIFISILASSCSYDIDFDLAIEGIYRININMDFTAKCEIDILMNSSELNIINIVVNPIDELRNEFESQGYRTKVYVNRDKTGIYAYKYLDNVEEALGVFAYCISDIDVSNSVEEIRISTEEGWFYNTYTIRADLNLLGELGDYDFLERFSIKTVLSQIDNLKFILELPILTEKNNASYVSDDGKILEWYIIPTTNNPIELQIKIPNKRNIVFSITLGSLILLLIIFILLKYNKVNRYH